MDKKIKLEKIDLIMILNYKTYVTCYRPNVYCHDITIYASFHGNDVFMHAHYRKFGHW